MAGGWNDHVKNIFRRYRTLGGEFVTCRGLFQIVVGASLEDKMRYETYGDRCDQGNTSA